MNRSWTKIGRPMERTFADHVKWAVAVLIGVAAGYLLFGNGDTGLLVGSLIGVVLVIVTVTVAQRVSRHFRR